MTNIPPRLLLVEPEPEVAALIREALSGAGAAAGEIEAVTSLDDAVRRLDQGGIDVVLLDLGLPGGGGREAVRALAGRDPAVPVVALAAGGDEAAAAVAAGAADGLARGEISSAALARALRLALERTEADEARSLAAKKWRAALDAVPEALFLTDAAGRIQQCNRAFAEHCRRPFGEIIGRPCSRIVHGDKGASGLCPLVRARVSGRRERMILVKNGQEFEMTVDPVAGPDGGFEGAVHTIRDVTAIRSAVRKQQLTAEVLQILSRGTGLPALVPDIVNSIRQVFDIEAGAVRLLRGNDYPYAFADGFSSSFLRLEFPLAMRDGSMRIVRGPEGRPEYACPCGAVIKGAADPRMTGLSLGGSFWANGKEDFVAAARIGNHGLPPQAPCVREGFESLALIPIRAATEILGLLLLFDHRPGRFSADRIAYLEGLAAAIGVAFRRLQQADEAAAAEAGSRSLLERASGRTAGEAGEGGRTKAEEERDRLQEQLLQAQKVDAVGMLAGALAGEIDIPVQGILDYAELLGERLPGDKRTLECVEGIKTEGGRIALLAKDLLRFSQQETPEPPVPVRVADAVEAVLSLVRAALRRDGIKLRVEVPKKLPPMAGRGRQIQQVLMNLVSNARDALNDKYPGAHEKKVLRVAARAVEEGGRRWIRLTVEDSGPGIPEEVREHLFKPLFTTKPKGKGAGLGLPISYGIVCDHGGRLWLESVPGEGARFNVELPAAPERERAPRPAPGPAGGPRRTSPRRAAKPSRQAAARRKSAGPRKTTKRGKRPAPAAAKTKKALGPRSGKR
ncbi:MAG TPA: ATP-binding protein [Candidatus Aminicenantes bacterium]|nr:ATP-binding protein [Candidatus Aminicenantes bacterium]HRY66117.1 ATP-binding protein [Candidatus Aminicenantes bacterium]HRZ73031.1 ATP-binding protein [Candidatus Aminicenantes bacterium]